MSKNLAKDVVIYGGADFLFKMIGFATFPIYAHVFSVTDYGLMSLLGVTAGLVGMLVNLGVNNAVQRFYWDPETKDGHHAILVSTGLLQLLCAGLVVLFCLLLILYPARSWVQDRFGIEWGLIVLTMCAIIPDQILQYALDTIRLHFTPMRFLILSFLKNILGVALGLWLIIGLGKGLYGFFGGALITSLLSVPIALWFIRKDLVRQFDWAVARKVFHYGYPFVFAGLAYWVFGSMDRWLLAELGNTTEVGLYSIAFKFATVVIFVNGAFGQAWSPYAIKLMRDDVNYRKTYSGIFSLWFFLLSMMGLAISVFAKEALMLLTPKEYWAASTTLGVATMGGVLYGTTQITALGISLEKRTGLLTHGAWLTALVNFVLNVLLIPTYGALGSAFATLISYAVLTCFFLYWTQRLHPLPLEKNRLLFCCIVVLMGLVIPQLLAHAEQGGILILIKVLLLSLAIVGAWVVGIIDKRWLGFLLPSRS